MLDKTIVETLCQLYPPSGTGSSLFASSGGPSDWQQAYHGTCMSCMPQIMSFGLMPGPNLTDNTYGVYCERPARRNSCLNYMPHQSGHQGNADLVDAIHLNILVDRRRGQTVNNHWVQPPGTVVILGLLLHAIVLADVLNIG